MYFFNFMNLTFLILYNRIKFIANNSKTQGIAFNNFLNHTRNINKYSYIEDL